MLAAIVTLFHPQEDQLKNLKKLSLSEGLDLLILVQNSDEDLSSLGIPNSVLIKNYNVGGIAGAFNRGAEKAFQQGADTLVFLDQDSKVPFHFFPDMLRFMKSHSAKMAAPDFIDINSKTHGTYFQFGFWKLKSPDHAGGYLKSNVAISSGTFISKNAFQKIGPFWEDLIIDHVDTDFNFRAFLAGIDIYINKSVLLEHSIGSRTKHRLLGLLTIKPTHHSARRHYYRSRNGMALFIKYYAKCPALACLIFKWNVHDILSIVFFEKHKLASLRACLKGFSDGLKGRLGLF